MMKSFENLKYLAGFDSEFQSEDPRTPGALPYAQNTPQKVFQFKIYFINYLLIYSKTFSAPTVSMLSSFPVQHSLLRGSIIIEAGSIAFYPLLNIQDSHRQRVRKNLNGIPLTQIQIKSDGSPSKFQRNQQILCRVCTLCVALETLK